jgi:hypothetical protein
MPQPDERTPTPAEIIAFGRLVDCARMFVKAADESLLPGDPRAKPDYTAILIGAVEIYVREFHKAEGIE